MSRCSPKESRGPPASGSIMGFFISSSAPPPPLQESSGVKRLLLLHKRGRRKSARMSSVPHVFSAQNFSHLKNWRKKKVTATNKLETFFFFSAPQQQQQHHLSDRLLLLSSILTIKKNLPTCFCSVFSGIFPEWFSCARSTPCDVTKGAPRSAQRFKTTATKKIGQISVWKVATLQLSAGGCQQQANMGRMMRCPRGRVTHLKLFNVALWTQRDISSQS